MAVEVSLTMSGLITYALNDKAIDAVMPAMARHRHSRRPGHSHPEAHDADIHMPALILPLYPLRADSSPPDQVFDTAADEVGLWLLDNTVMDVSIDDGTPQPSLEYGRPFPTDTRAADDVLPGLLNEGHLRWLADVRRAAANPECTLKEGCVPPVNPELVSAVVRLTVGEAEAYWSSVEARRQVWEFVSPDGSSTPDELPKYEQALADGLTWVFRFKSHAEIRLTSTVNGSPRSIYLVAPNPNDKEICGTISHKSPTVAGKSLLRAPQRDSLDHFSLYYDLVVPSPDLANRRIPRELAAATRTNRCPAAAA